MSYTLNHHRHRFGQWAASRAAGRGSFGNEDGAYLLDKTDISSFSERLFAEPDILNSFDDKHRYWREEIVRHAIGKNVGRKDEIFSHGRAAKLINVYLKTTVICALPSSQENTHPSAHIIHPPIDSILLSALSKYEKANLTGWSKSRCPWLYYNSVGWTKFDSQQYEGVIKEIKRILNGKPLWLVEEHWIAHKKIKH